METERGDPSENNGQSTVYYWIEHGFHTRYSLGPHSVVMAQCERQINRLVALTFTGFQNQAELI